MLKEHVIQISMDGKGCWMDNVFIEPTLAQPEVRESVSQGLRQRCTGTATYQRLDGLLQPRQATCQPGQNDTDAGILLVNVI